MVEIGTDSCKGKMACSGLERGIVSEDSCDGMLACSRSVDDTSTSFSIGQYSCLGCYGCVNLNGMPQ